MQNNQQFLNNQNSPNNNMLNPSQQDAYYQEAFNKLSQSRINDMDRTSIQRILEVASNVQQFDNNQQNIPQKMPSQIASKIEQNQRIKSIYHPPNFDTFNVKDGQPQNENNNNGNNNFGLDINFGTPNPDLLKQSNLKKLNDQQSGGSNQLYGNLNNNNQPSSQDTNNYFFKSSQQQQSTIQKPQQPPAVDNFGTPNPDYSLNQWNQQNQFQPPQNQNNNVQPSSYNNNNNFSNNNNNNNFIPSNFNNNNNNNNNNNGYPVVGQQQPPKQPSSIQQQPVPQQQQQQSKLPAPQGKTYPMTSGIKPKSNGLVKIQTIKLCEQTINQMKSGSLEQVKSNLVEAIKLLDEIQL